MASRYEVGDPLSAEDLEFMRAYLLTGGEATSPTITTASYTRGDAKPNVQLASSSTTPINRSKTAYGTSVSQVGSLKLKVGEPNPLANSWSTSFTAKRTSGVSLTKIRASVSVRGYGATTSWPFVGLVYEKNQSATSAANAQSFSFNRSDNFGGAIVNLDLRTYADFWNKSGSFALP